MHNLSVAWGFDPRVLLLGVQWFRARNFRARGVMVYVPMFTFYVTWEGGA